MRNERGERRMLRACRAASVVAALLLPVAGAHGRRIPDLDITPPEIVVASPEVTLASCGGGSRKGCTVFTGITFRSACSEEPDGWRLRTRTRASARIFVSDFRYVRHEMLHVFDLNRRLQQYDRETDGAPFPTELECERASRGASETFAPAVRDWIRTSTEQRDFRLRSEK